MGRVSMSGAQLVADDPRGVGPKKQYTGISGATIRRFSADIGD